MQLIGRLRALAAAPSRRYLFWSSLLHGRSACAGENRPPSGMPFLPTVPFTIQSIEDGFRILHCCCYMQSKKNIFNLKPGSKLKYGVLLCFLSASAPASHACGDRNWIAGVSQDKSVLLPSQSFLEPGQASAWWLHHNRKSRSVLRPVPRSISQCLSAADRQDVGHSVPTHCFFSGSRERGVWKI